MMGFGMMGGSIFGILILVLVVFLVMRLFNNSNGYNPNNNSYPRNSDALETLKERYATDEIDENEYKRKLKILK